MSVADIKTLLDVLAELRQTHDNALRTWPMQAKLEALLTEAEALSKQRAEYLEPWAQAVADTERQVLDLTLCLGETVKGDALMAVWTRPRVSWDVKSLDGYAAAHPEILPFRHTGQPSVSIRPVRRDSDA